MRKMQLHEFDRLMIEQGGWTFPAEYYEEIIEPVYLELNEDKVEFVKFCHAKDLNGLELLKNYLPTVKKLAETGMNVFQIHAAIYLLAEKDYLIRELINMHKGLINKIVEQQEALKKASSKKSEKTLAIEREIKAEKLKLRKVRRELKDARDQHMSKEIDYPTYAVRTKILVNQQAELEGEDLQLEPQAHPQES